MDILSIFNESTTLESNGVSLDLTTVAPAGIKYLIEYGYAKSLQDKVAGMAKDGKSESEILAARESRRDAIAAGTIGHGSSGPRLKGLDKITFEVALEAVKTYAGKTGKAMPDGKGAADKIRGMVAKWMADPTRAAAVTNEAARRFSMQESIEGEPDNSLDDLFS